MKICQLYGVKGPYRVHSRSSTSCRDDWVYNPYYVSAAREIMQRNRSLRIPYTGLLSAAVRGHQRLNTLGCTFIDGEELLPLPPVVLEYPRKKGPLTMANFRKAQEEGRIVTTAVELGTIRVNDSPTVEPMGFSGVTELPCWSPFLRGLAGHSVDGCTGLLMERMMVHNGQPTGPVYDNSLSGGALGTNSVMVTYREYSGEASSLLRLYRPVIEDVVQGVDGVILNHPMDAGLITSTAADANASALDLMTEIAELPETMKMVYGGVKEILGGFKRTLRSAKRLQSRHSGKELWDRSAELWLQYRYGIKPVVYTVNDALDYLASRGHMYRTVRNSVDVVPSVNISGLAPFTVQLRDRAWGKTGYDSTKPLRGLGMNLANTAWETTRLSFVVDWAINVGDTLASWFPPPGAEQAFTYSRRVNQVVPLEVGGRPFDLQIDRYSRRLLNPIAHGGLTINPKMSVQRYLDAASLSWLLFLKDYRRF